MPWCLTCKSEYREGYTTCSDCGSVLVDELPPVQKEIYEPDQEAFLVSVTDKIEADVLEAKLQACDIPVMKKFKGTGGYLNVYMGMTVQGIDLYVPSKLLEEARQVIDTGKTGEVLADPEMAEEEEKLDRHRRVRAWIALLLLLPGTLAALIIFIRILIGFFSQR